MTNHKLGPVLFFGHDAVMPLALSEYTSAADIDQHVWKTIVAEPSINTCRGEIV